MPYCLFLPTNRYRDPKLSQSYNLKLGFNRVITCQVLVFSYKFTSNEVFNKFIGHNKGTFIRCYGISVHSNGSHIQCPLLLQDLPNAMNAAEITDKLALHQLRQRNWYIQATCATSGDGLYEGLDWLSNQLKNQK